MRDERQAAIDSLDQMNHPLIVEVLAEAVRHPVRQVRIGAAVHLAARQDPRAIPALLEGIRLQDERVEPWMLGEIGRRRFRLSSRHCETRTIGCATMSAWLWELSAVAEAVGALVKFLRDSAP